MRERLLAADRVVGAGAAGDAVMIRNGAIAAVGPAHDLRRPGLAEDRFPGGTIIPGLRDSHVHPTGYAGALQRLVVKDAADFDDLVQRVAAAAQNIPPGDTLVGIRLDDESLAERRLPTREVVDRASDQHPIILYRYCGHVAVANTMALELAGVGPDTADPFGGSLDRDHDGRPNGVLREHAVGMVGDMCGDRSSGLDPAHLRQASRHLAGLGLTSIGAMVTSGRGLWADASSELDLMVDAAPELAITHHVMVMTEDPDELESAAQRITRTGGRLRFLGVKVITDGSLGGHTAALDDPYSDRSDQRGLMRVERQATLDVARRSLALGGVVAIHAIGDAANAFTLDVFETLLEEGAPPHALRVEHASVLREPDIDRIGRLGVVASVQPAFLSSEQSWLGARLGDRLERTYAFSSMLENGAVLAGGSDCPVEPPHPLWGMAAAQERGVISPTEALTGSEALHAFTHGAAIGLGEAPPLASGSPADLVVLDVDPTTAAPSELRNGNVLATIVEGEDATHPSGSPWPG